MSAKVNEKTLELNLCAEITHAFSMLGFKTFWRGLTQAEEKRWGYDVKSVAGGFTFIIQWKALSRINDKKGTRTFQFSDPQMQKLVRLSKIHPRLVYYGLPLFWNWQEVRAAGHRLLPDTRFLEVAQLQKHHSLGKQGSHAAVIDPTRAQITVHSMPTSYKLKSFVGFDEAPPLIVPSSSERWPTDVNGLSDTREIRHARSRIRDGSCRANVYTFGEVIEILGGYRNPYLKMALVVDQARGP